MRYIQSPPNHRGPRVLLAVALSVGVHLAAVGLAGVLSAATPTTLEVDPPTDNCLEPGGYEPLTVDLPGLEVPPPEVPVVEILPPIVEVAVVEEPPPSTTTSPDFFEPTPTPARRNTAATQTSAPRTVAPATRANFPPGVTNPGGGAAPGAGGATGNGRWITPKPPYPPMARTMRQTGSGSVRVQTDASGRVVSAEMIQPITPPLDAATTSFARGHWSGPPNRTVVIPVTFRLQ